jgi:ATP-dependent helicase/nuclease subunit A
LIDDFPVANRVGFAVFRNDRTWMTARPQFTDQQARAIETRHVSIALSAGAGCGKTFVLTQRFLAELAQRGESETDLHQLVAITFTDRAAREMRDRIRAACDERLQNCEPNEVAHWLGILRGLDGARISTIHSFCTGLLRSHAVEASLDPRFGVLDAAVADTLLRHVARDTLHTLLEDWDDDAIQFSVQFGLERAEELLRKLTRQRFQIDFTKFNSLLPEELANHWLQRWHTEFVPKLVAKFRESALVAEVLESIQGSPSKNQTMIDRISNLNAVLPAGTPWRDAVQTLEDIRENARVQKGGGKAEWISEERQQAIKQLFEKLRAQVVSLTGKLDVSQEDVSKSAELACRAIRLTQRTAENYAVAKKSQGSLDFDDLLLHARNLLRDHETVRQRIAAGIRLLMVDEFQDTDPIQADVVRSLCGAALTQGKLFMVGDRKQSIYRFRRADPTVFAMMSEELPPNGRLPLNVNFRSQPAVLNFVNQLFAPAMEKYEPLVPFQNVQYSPTPAIEFLFAGFDADDTDAATPVVTNAITPVEDDLRPNAMQLRGREANWIGRRLAALLADPTPRIRTREKEPNGNPRLRRVEPGDIVILFRALSNVQQYEAALRNYGLDYYLVGGKAFFAQQEVFDLLNLCRYLADCDDLVGLVGILRSPFFNISDDAIQALSFQLNDEGSDQSDASSTSKEGRGAASLNMPASRRIVSIHEALYRDPPTWLPADQQSRLRFAAEVLTELRQQKDRIPLPDLLTKVIEQTGYDAALLAEFLGERKLANLRKLIEMARQFDREDTFTLKDFVTRLQTSVLEETDEEFATTQPESGNVIRLMSIHQSKGLEFPVVVVADIDRKGPPRGSDAVLHPELGALVKLPEQFGESADNLALKMHKLVEEEADAEETIRLFYVACTRAADYLILSTGLDPEKPVQSSWRELVESRFDIQTGLLKFDPLLGASSNTTAGREQVPDIFVHRVPCNVKPSDSLQRRVIAPGIIPGKVLASEPGDFPASARLFARDFSDFNVFSVSRLESIDAELNGATHTRSPAPRRLEDDAEVDRDQATHLGVIIHETLERLRFDEPESWPDLLAKAVEHSPDLISDGAVEQARTMLTRFSQSSLARELASAKTVHREIDFMLPWPSPQVRTTGSDDCRTMISGIIDLLIETESGWEILDYKTGDFPLHASAEQLLVPYELQLGIYAFAVNQWFGVEPRMLSLISFRPEVRRITLPWNSARWEKLRSRIDRAIDAIRSSVTSH